MKSHRRNEGIIVTGGQLNAGQIAAGSRAKAIKVSLEGGFDATAAQGELRDAVERLTDLVVRYEHETQSSGKALASIAALVEEARKPKPVTSKLNELLDKISNCSGSVAAIVKAIASVRDVIAAGF